MKTYLLDHWSGRQSLLWASFVNGVAGYFLVVAFGFAADALFGQRSIWISLAVMLAWLIWASVGIVRSAIRLFRNNEAAIGSKIGAAVAIALTAIVLALSARDVWVVILGW